MTAGDLVSAARARDTLHRLGARPGWDAGRVALVVNRHDPAYHFEPWQLERSLGAPAAAVVPFDHTGVQRALAAGQAVALDGRSRAGRVLLGLADRLHGGGVRPARAPGPVSGAGAGRVPTAAVRLFAERARRRLATALAAAAAVLRAGTGRGGGAPAAGSTGAARAAAPVADPARPAAGTPPAEEAETARSHEGGVAAAAGETGR